MKLLSDSEIEEIYRNAVSRDLISIEDTSVIFYSSEILQDRIELLKAAFPPETLHAVAIKANASPAVLELIAQEGLGLEAASFEEVLMAVEAGVPYDRIVFDSPVKTHREIQHCHKMMPGMTVNANSLEELSRYPVDFSGHIGLRINPVEESDAPDMWNVSREASKFGVDINRDPEIIQACVTHIQITGLHVHVGSGIRDFQANVISVKKVCALAQRINEKRRSLGIDSRIEFIDIGGGILFEGLDGDRGLKTFVDQLKNETSLFEDYRVITEYGKFVHNDAGFVVSDIEYVLPATNQQDPSTAFIHVGADLFVRKVYSDLPIDFPFSIIKGKGNQQTGTGKYNIAGPLCFAGDFLYYDIEIPALIEGDKFVIQRTGANTLSMWSGHCNRRIPKLIILP